MGVVGIARVVAMARPLAVLPGHKEGGDTVADILADLQQCHHLPRPSWTLHLQLVTIVEMIPLQSLSDQEIHWKLGTAFHHYNKDGSSYKLTVLLEPISKQTNS